MFAPYHHPSPPKIPLPPFAKEAQADEQILAGQPIYLKATGHCAIARMDDIASATVAGVAVRDAATGFTCGYIADGFLDLADWSAVAGSSTLTPGANYYLAGVGTISTVPPAEGFYVEIGQAKNLYSLEVERSNPMRL